MRQHTIHISHSPSLRARLTQGAIAMMTNMTKIDLKNYKFHRDKLDRMSDLVPKVKSVSYLPERVDDFTAEWMIPAQSRKDQILYYLHGGGYALCSVGTHRRLIATLACVAQMKAFAINYRLAPEHPFPAALDDAVKGYEHLLQRGFSPKKIFIAGDSAGGGLAIATLLELRQKGMPLPAAAACISPWADLEGTGSSHITNTKTEKLLDLPSVRLWGKAYAGKESTRHPLISPIYADLSGLPPLYIQVSSSEILLDDSVRLHARALECGVDSTLEKWKGLIHVWHVHTFLPEARTALKNIAKFAARHIQQPCGCFSKSGKSPGFSISRKITLPAFIKQNFILLRND